VKYPDNQKIIDKLAEMVCIYSGDNAWKKLTRSEIPTGNMSNKELSMSMQAILEGLEIYSGKETTREIMHRVRHALTRDSYKTARTDFLRFNNIDDFAHYIWDRQIFQLKECMEQNKLFFDQPIDKAAYEYALSVPELFFGKRYGDVILAEAIPYRLVDYMKTDNNREKRYFMCHCQFARESILQDKTVSGSMCFCSMGHVKLFWEAALDMELQGNVVKSVLNGDDKCIFEIYLPHEIMNQYI